MLEKTEESMPLRREQRAENENYWQIELSLLASERKRKNEFKDKKELVAFATTAIKEVYFQDYKTAAYDDTNTEIDESHLDYII